MSEEARCDYLALFSSDDDYLKITHPIDVKEDAETFDLIANRILDVLDLHQELPYVTANQIGYDYSVFGLRLDDGIEIYANPLVSKTDADEMMWSYEQEYDLEDKYILMRWKVAKVIAYSYSRKLVTEREYSNEAACIVQHALNNLNGVSIKDFGLVVTDEFEKAAAEEKQEVLVEYQKSLLELLDTLESDIESDSEARWQYEAVKFAKARAAGTIEVEKKRNRKARRWFERLQKRKEKKKKKWGF